MDGQPHGDGASDREESLADTNPLDPTDQLRITAITVTDRGEQTELTWTSQSTRQYQIQTRPTLGVDSLWLNSVLGLQSPDPGATTTRTIPGSADPQHLYRIQAVQPIVDPGISILSIQRTPFGVVVSWTRPDHVPQTADSLAGPWLNVASAVSPYFEEVLLQSRYYRTAQGGFAAAAAGAGVYSVNVVGYVNHMLGPGQHLIASPLITIDNHLNTVLPLPDAASGTTVRRFNVGTQAYKNPITWASAPGRSFRWRRGS